MTPRVSADDLKDGAAKPLPADRGAYFAADPSAVLSDLTVSAEMGLSPDEVEARLLRYGPNRAAEPQAVSDWIILARQFASSVVLLLVAAMILSIALQDWPEAIAIGVVLLINTAIGFVSEQRAIRSMDALRRLDIQRTRVRRAGLVQIVTAESLVPGDIVLIEAGDRVPADMRILSASRLSADESALTGESLPNEKGATSVPPETKLHDRTSMLYKGTSITDGAAEAVVTATGRSTELGRIAALVETAEGSRSPLEERLAVLAHQLVWLTLAIALALFAIGLWSGQPLIQMIQATIALAVAAIPEGLPIVATLALARGMVRMARNNALVRSLGSVETLGATTVILTDKTGTLTENRMAVRQVVTPAGSYALDPVAGRIEPIDHSGAGDTVLTRALEIAALCSNATLSDDDQTATGDPMEVALLRAARLGGVHPNELRAANPRLLEHAFDTVTRMMATIHDDGETTIAAIKGAPESVLAQAAHVLTPQGPEALTPGLRARIEAATTDLARQGYRLIALAENPGESRLADPYSDLTLVAVAALQDPPRQDIPAAIRACHLAGIHVVMVTGDHPATAFAIASSVGLDPDRHGDAVHARVTPSEKLEIVDRFQEAGQIVAMTGDGVNDAPALKKADIGIAMGIRGTDVAREAADIVLLDDAFSTIVTAIREGRVIFANIRRFCVYLLSCNLGEVLLIALALFAGMPLPLLPLQILFLNLVTDVFPALALATGEGDGDVIARPPRPADEPILARRHWVRIAVFGVLIGIAALVAFLVAILEFDASPKAAATIAFLTIGAAQLWHVFNMRDPGSGVFVNHVTRTPLVWAALAGCIVLLLLTVYLPPLRLALDIVPPTREGWLLIGVASLMPLIAGQVVLEALRRGSGAHGD